MFDFITKEGKNVSFTPKEAKIVVQFYRYILSMLDEISKNPKMIPVLQRSLYEAIREIENAQSKTKEKDTEENPNKTEWKPFLAQK